MTVQGVIEKIESFLKASELGVYVTTDIYEQALDRRLPFVLIDENGTEIINNGSDKPHRIKVKLSIMCVVLAKNKTFKEYRNSSEVIARNVIASLQQHDEELTIVANEFTNQEMLIGSIDVSAVNISCETWVNY